MYIITLNSRLYPRNLRDIPNPPEKLYVEGKFQLRDEIAVAIVGTRKMTDYGRDIAIEFSRSLARAGITVISGLARGIDTIAHTHALKDGGRTIAVLGSGLDIMYPPENKPLSENIKGNGALISQFKEGTEPEGKNFLIRNRTIVGLSKAIIVVEGERRSGTLSTASHAAALGREVFAVPGPITSPQSAAPLYLIENGARIAKSPKDILEYMLTS